MDTLTLEDAEPDFNPLIVDERDRTIAILEAECRQMRELLDEALSDSSNYAAELIRARHDLSEARHRQQQLEEKLTMVQTTAGGRPSAKRIGVLRAELEQAKVALTKASQTIYELTLFTGGPMAFMGPESSAPFAATREQLMGSIDSIDRTLSETNG